MNKHDSPSRPTCSLCGSNEIVLKARTQVGDTRTDDVIRTEMLGCAVISRYLTCAACGQNLTRAEYESFQKSGGCLD
jgi:hypothetical protein